MSNPKIIENRISLTKKYLKILQRYKTYSQKEIENDLNLKGAVERYLYLAVQATIDLAEALIAYKKFRKPTSFKEAFYILNEEEIINYDLNDQMLKMTGFRNIIAHDYEKVDYSIVYDILQNRLVDIEKFIGIMAKQI